MTPSAKTLRALDVEAIDLLLNAVCYKPGDSFKHILYCRWCFYASNYPHDDSCIVARHAAALKRKRTGRR